MNGYFWQAAYFPIRINWFSLKFRINFIDAVDADGGRFIRVGEHLDIAELLNWNINNAIEIEGFEEGPDLQIRNWGFPSIKNRSRIRFFQGKRPMFRLIVGIPPKQYRIWQNVMKIKYIRKHIEASNHSRRLIQMCWVIPSHFKIGIIRTKQTNIKLHWNVLTPRDGDGITGWTIEIGMQPVEFNCEWFYCLHVACLLSFAPSQRQYNLLSA